MPGSVVSWVPATVNGTVVVPVALVLEWFARAARACRPDLVLCSIFDLKVQRGIRLLGHGRCSERLLLGVRTLENGQGATLALELTAPDGTPHYVASCELRERAAAAPSPGGVDLASLRPWTLPVYDGKLLFHGPELQVIESVLGVSEAAMVATLSGLLPRAWPGTWQLDPAILDGALQVMLLWARHRLGRATLPTAIGRLQVYATGPVRGRVRCVLTGTEVARERATARLELLDEDGRLLAELVGVEVHALAQGAPSPNLGVPPRSGPALRDA